MTIRIYVANLGKYNEGELVGQWIALPATSEELKALMQEIQIDGVMYEEVAIHDYESDIEGLKIGEYDSIDKLNELAAELEGLQDSELEVIGAIMEQDSYYNLKSALEVYQNGDYSYYSGVSDEKELGYYVVDEGLFGVEIPEALQNYLDYESIGRDWRINAGGTFTAKGYIEVR